MSNLKLSNNNNGNQKESSSFFQKVMKSPSTQNLLNSFSSNNNNNNSNNNNNNNLSNSGSNEVKDTTTNSPSQLPPNYTPPPPPHQIRNSSSIEGGEFSLNNENSDNNNMEQLARTESSVSIISSSSSGSATSGQPNLQRHSSNISTDDSNTTTETYSMSPNQTLNSNIDSSEQQQQHQDLSSSVNNNNNNGSNNNTHESRKLTRKIAQFISSPKLLQSSISQLPSTPTQQNVEIQTTNGGSPNETSPNGLISPRPSNDQPLKEKEKKKKKFLKTPEIFKHHHHHKESSTSTTTPSSLTSSPSSSSLAISSPNTTSTNNQNKKSHKKTKSTFDINTEISVPYNVIHKMHVDFDLKWTGHNDFKLDEKLGDGAYGSVYKGTHKDLGFTLAIKVIEMKESESVSLQNEINILKNCKSPNIVSYFGSLQTESHIWILLDFCALGSIRDIIESTEKTLNEAQISFVVKNTLKGLIYLHSQNIIHRDVKAANVLLSEGCDVKIADFGVSEKLNGALDQSKEMIGTPLWMAPEVILKKNYDYKADIWSLGITIIEMADGLPPHIDLPPMRAMKMVPNWPPPTFAEPKKWSPLLNDFLARCLVKDPEKRASPIDLLCHPFLKKDRGPDVLSDLVNQLFKIKKKKIDDLKKQQKHQTSQSSSSSSPQSPNATVNGVDIGSDGLSTSIISPIPSSPSDELDCNNSLKLATSSKGMLSFKGNYTTCRDFQEEEEDSKHLNNNEDEQEDEDDEDEDDENEDDEDVDPFSTTIFHGKKKGGGGGCVTSDQDDEEDEEEEEEEDEDENDEDEDEDEDEINEDEEISATGTMVVRKKKKKSTKKSNKKKNNLSTIGKSGSGNNLLHVAPNKPLPITPPFSISMTNEFKQLETKLFTYIDNSNQKIVNDIKNEIKQLESSIINKININLQQHLSPILLALEEIKQNQHTTSQPIKQMQSKISASNLNEKKLSSSPPSSNSPLTNSVNSSSSSSSSSTTTTTTTSPVLSRQSSFRSSGSISSSNSSFRPNSATMSTVNNSSTTTTTNSNNSYSNGGGSGVDISPTMTGRASPSIMKRFTTSSSSPLSSSSDGFTFNSNNSSSGDLKRHVITPEELNNSNLVKNKVKMFEDDNSSGSGSNSPSLSTNSNTNNSVTNIKK
ncbi:hypothetical protein ACTFIY_003171 [Dictyostelium cf. discoideum]